MCLGLRCTNIAPQHNITLGNWCCGCSFAPPPPSPAHWKKKAQMFVPLLCTLSADTHHIYVCTLYYICCSLSDRL